MNGTLATDKADQDMPIAAHRLEHETYLAWKRAAQKLRDVLEDVRDRYVQQQEGR